MLWLRQSPFAKGGWGLTYASKTRKAQVLSAGSTMNNLHWIILPCQIKEPLELSKTQICFFTLLVLDLTYDILQGQGETFNLLLLEWLPCIGEEISNDQCLVVHWVKNTKIASTGGFRFMLGEDGGICCYPA